MIEFRMPSLGADMEGGKLVQWFKRPGDVLHRGDIIALVETQKGAIEIEVFNEGTVGEHVAQPGQTVPVGTVIATILSPDEKRSEMPVSAATPRATMTAASSAELIGSKPAEPIADTPKALAPISPVIRATPAARRRAAELGIDLDTLTPGRDGVVGLDQIKMAMVDKPAPQKVEPGARPGLDLGEMRKAVAAIMARSHREIPHYWVCQMIDVTPLLRWIEAENTHRPVTRRLLYVAPLMKAIAVALKEAPRLNGHCLDGTFWPLEAVHMGVATALRGGGLVAPAIRDVDTLDLDSLMAGLADLVPRARAGRLRSSEMTDGTITLSNLGEGSADTVLPLIYPPQVAIIGCGAATARPWAVGETVAVRQVMNVTVGGDHRVSHGRQAAKFLVRLAQLLEHPEAL